MREPKNQMLGTMEPPLMQLSVNFSSIQQKIIMRNKYTYLSMSKYAPGAVYIQIMVLEHIELRILPQIIHALGAAAPGAAVLGAAAPGA